jgi:hypothetical protein
MIAVLRLRGPKALIGAASHQVKVRVRVRAILRLGLGLGLGLGLANPNPNPDANLNQAASCDDAAPSHQRKMRPLLMP